MKKFLRNNGLSLVLFALFFLSLVGQFFTGQREYNDGQKQHGSPPISAVEYLKTGHFVEAVFENWESEFLQMGAFVLLTAFLYQKGSPESKDPDKKEAVDADPARSKNDSRAPYPVRRGGLMLKIYENSLSLALFALFFLSFVLHGMGGAREYNEEQREHNETQISTFDYFGTSRFWFESFQNWQSEFLSIGAMIVLSIYLRQKGSPESKPVDAPHDETGSE